MKALYYGDNLQVLRDSIATESVGLIYLDPPFNSSATYNVGLLGESGWRRAMARSAAFSHMSGHRVIQRREFASIKSDQIHRFAA